MRLCLLPPLLSACILLLAFAPARAASFDCAKAATATEKAICADGPLSQMDQDLAQVWRKALAIAPAPAVLKAAQRQWLRRRDECGADAPCLLARYRERLAALAKASSIVETDLAGNRLEGLNAPDSGKPTPGVDKGCTVDQHICVQIVAAQADTPPFMQIDIAGANAASYRFALPPAQTDGVDQGITLWPTLLRLADGDTLLVGAEYHVSASYSGGGGQAAALQLFEISRNGAALRSHPVLSVPTTGSILIRACFSERDMRQRRGACHDEYEFDGQLGLDPRVKAGPPRLVYQTEATSYPGKVSRDQDSLAALPLRKRDLVTVANQRCSFKRIFQLGGQPRAYTPDRPLPDCSNYTVP
ncbi:Protein of unknown function [Andreprevotia lacus DSM 23236]|jgi:uncharacterized protein|uniref:Lysozyme inhibitor LprI-like N-terminal domain-containing protein n=1 Tax=Andreprevotia lacus DSM 23236 TaxID=1121001 RepID=A0A1W1XTU9_9NEIS|nr:lysozyme inhibitor LprI family protein [Andreprevotia lacus]SMC27317.1 Protein of unknown function [Andreprevotia lacus DSM 23236]